MPKISCWSLKQLLNNFKIDATKKWIIITMVKLQADYKSKVSTKYVRYKIGYDPASSNINSYTTVKLEFLFGNNLKIVYVFTILC